MLTSIGEYLLQICFKYLIKKMSTKVNVLEFLVNNLCVSFEIFSIAALILDWTAAFACDSRGQRQHLWLMGGRASNDC